MRPRDWLLPGFGHWRLGFQREATKYFLFMGLWLAVVVLRLERIAEIAGDLSGEHALENWVALLFLALWPALWMGAARRGLRRLLHPLDRGSMSQWHIAAGLLKRNRRAVIGARILGVAYMIAFLCPVLSPYDPERIPRDGVVNKNQPPFGTVYALGDTTRGEVYCRDFQLRPDGRLFLDRVEDHAHRTLPLSRIGEPRGGWTAPPNGTREIEGRAIPYRAELHVLGTDEVGRDLLAGLMYGSRISLSIGFVAMLIAVAIGSFVGTVAGYLGGWADFALMRFVDVLMAFPRLLLLLLVYAGFAANKQEVSIFLIVAILGATGWMGISRLVRAQILSLKEEEYTTAARGLGASPLRIMFRHLLPNSMAPIIVDGTLRVGNTILVEAALSFLGFGVQKPTPSWGNIVQGGSKVLGEAWWIATLPGLAIVVVVVSINLVGDALRDALDPKLR
ncbi:MAG: ABC transporter permease [Planctomycetota bacterium]|jgi:peptide/nickel transport system permease protein